MNAAGMIEDAGFEVVEATNAEEAIMTPETRLASESSLPTSKCPAQWMA
jgi:hypothetical protein